MFMMCFLPVEPCAADHSGQEVRSRLCWQPVVGPPNSRHGLSFSRLSVWHPVLVCRHGRSPHPERKRLALMSSLRSPGINFLMCMLLSDSAGPDSKLITLPTQRPQEFRQHLQQAASGRSPRPYRERPWSPLLRSTLAAALLTASSVDERSSSMSLQR